MIKTKNLYIFTETKKYLTKITSQKNIGALE